MSTAAELQANAEAKFKRKELQRLDGCAAMAEYDAASRATIEKTARLRALRLSQAERAPPVATAKAPAKSKTKRPAKAGARRAVAV
ncbi:MAG: transcriptional regulator [Xanthobacteraceae bacterium]|nr:transcriptional regulator [Xanthobacteraceae bacterium]